MLTLLQEPKRYLYLDAAQLVKHALGFARCYADRTVTLLYLYWEPRNAERRRQRVAEAGLAGWTRQQLRRSGDRPSGVISISVALLGLPPAPGRRTRVGSIVSPRRTSRNARPMVLRAMPVARATAVLRRRRKAPPRAFAEHRTTHLNPLPDGRFINHTGMLQTPPAKRNPSPENRRSQSIHLSADDTLAFPAFIKDRTNSFTCAFMISAAIEV